MASGGGLRRLVSIVLFGLLLGAGVWYGVKKLAHRIDPEPVVEDEAMKRERLRREAAERKAREERNYAQVVAQREQQQKERTAEHASWAESDAYSRLAEIAVAREDTAALAGPSADAEPVVRVSAGERYEIAERDGEWVSLVNEYGFEMWLPLSIIDEVEERVAR